MTLSKLLKGCLIGSVACLISQVAYAQNPPMRYEIMQQHLVDQPAQMRIIANENLKNIDVTIHHCANKPIKQHIDKMKAGEIQMISWKQNEGKYQCNIQITGRTGLDTAWNVNASHEFVSTSPIQLNVNLRELAPDVSDVMLHANKAFQKAQITVTAEDGTRIDTVEKEVGNVKDYKLAWTPNGKPPALLQIRIDDGTGAWATNTIFYFKVPHTDIVFDTNHADIRNDQTVHLQETLDKMKDILNAHQKVAVDLYITGHTDTVGSTTDNDKLSLNRAKSIASWFRQNGLTIPMYYRGAGERGLAVQTPDNTPNEQNRRAVYILSNRPPLEANSLGEWRKL